MKIKCNCLFLAMALDLCHYYLKLKYFLYEFIYPVIILEF